MAIIWQLQVASEDAFKSMVTAILSSIRDIITALLAKAIAGVIAGDAVKGGTIGLLSAGAIGIPMLMGIVVTSTLICRWWNSLRRYDGKGR